MSDVHSENKALISRYSRGLYDIDPASLEGHLEHFFAPHAEIHLATPFEDVAGPKELHERVYRPLLKAMPDLERRNMLMVAGPSDGGSSMVGTAGHYIGVFEQPWLDIPPTCHPVLMRYHEFFRIEDGRIVEMQALWDIVHVMMQARAWPLSPSLGVDWPGPAPASQDGLLIAPRDEDASEKSMKLVLDMLDGLHKHATGGPEAMELHKYWHPKMTWYGPAGIGTNRRISGFRNWHQIPFLKALPDRWINDEVPSFFFGDGNYVGVTAWPGMKMTVSGDGWLGIPAAGQKIYMRSLDFWRREGDLLRENWVLVDLLHVYDQLGVDVFNRMREYTVARQVNKPVL